MKVADAYMDMLVKPSKVQLDKKLIFTNVGDRAQMTWVRASLIGNGQIKRSYH